MTTITDQQRREVGKMQILSASSKFAICGLPLRADTYKTCSFGCHYCFSNSAVIRGFAKVQKVGDVAQFERRIARVENGGAREGDFIDSLLAAGVTIHCGALSDPFQPCESEFHITGEVARVTREHGVSVLFSTKTDDLRGVELDPELHTMQLSVTNMDGCQMEPNVTSGRGRRALFDRLKSSGFRVGIRIQPFIPGVTDERIVDLFKDADQITIEGLKIVPQNRACCERVLDETGLSKSDFRQMGLLNLKPGIRKRLYAPLIARLEENGTPYSIADNDMHDCGTNFCCCGDRLVSRATGFDTTAMCKKYTSTYGIEEVFEEAEPFMACKVNQLFTSNRQEGCTTLEDFYQARFDRASSPFSPKFLDVNKED